MFSLITELNGENDDEVTSPVDGFYGCALFRGGVMLYIIILKTSNKVTKNETTLKSLGC